MAKRINNSLEEDSKLFEKKGQLFIKDTKLLVEGSEIRKLEFYNKVIGDLIKKQVWILSDFKKANWVYRTLEEFKKENTNKLFVPILEKLLIIAGRFHKRINKYRSFSRNMFCLRNKKDFFDTFRTQKSDDDTFLKLIEYDKEFLFVWRERILRAQAFDDNRFFQRLASAIKKGTSPDLKKIKKSSEHLRDLIILAYLNDDVLPIKDLYNPKNLRELKKILHLILMEDREELENTINDSKIIKTEFRNKMNMIDGALKILNDENYFMYKWLPRHILGGDTKKSS